MSSIRDGSKPARGVESGGAAPGSPAYPDLMASHASRNMAHPVRRGPFPLRPESLASSTPGAGSEASGGFASRLLGRFTPRGGRGRELAAVLALLVAAAVISASLPGGWTSSTSPSPAAELVADATAAGPTPTATPPPDTTSADTSLPSPDPTATPSPSPSPTAGQTNAPKKAAVKPAVHKVYTFVALGDSLTAWPTDGPWPTRLDAEDANLRLVHNAGVPGDTTAEMLARLNGDVFAYKPQVLFIMGGTNDLGRNISQATTIANLRAIIVAAEKKGIRIDLMTVPPDNYTDMVAKIDSLNAAIVHLGNIYKLVVIDIHTPLSTSKGVYVPKYTSDGLHFSALGAQVVANTIYARIHRYGF